jgi:hypothetical protein
VIFLFVPLADMVVSLTSTTVRRSESLGVSARAVRAVIRVSAMVEVS